MTSPLIAIFVCFLFVKHNHGWAYRNKFDEMKLSPYYVDKTEFFRLLFDPVYTSSLDQFYFLTAPHRFGKSTLLRMIQSFCEVELDSDGNIRPWVETNAMKVFKGTKISQYEHILENHLARYPVLYLDLTKYAAMHQSHRKIATELNQKYLDTLKPYTLRLNKIQTYIRDGFPDNCTMSISSRRFIQTLFAKNITIQSLDSSLMLLVKFVYELFDNTPVMLLIDEYDNTALRSYIFQRGYTARNYRKLNRIIFKLLKGGKTYVKNIFMMAVSSLAFAADDLLPKFMTHLCFLNDHSFMPYIGITSNELTELFDKYECSEEERKAVTEFYNPYRTSIKKTLMFHPYSINSYFAFRTMPDYQDALKPYWKKLEAQGLNAPFYRSSLFRKTIDDLMSNQTVRLKLRKQQPSDALDTLELLRDTNFDRITDQQVFIFLRLYFELGYLSHSGRDAYAYVVPNIDTRMIIEYDRHVYWTRYAHLDLNVTRPTTVHMEDKFIPQDADVVAADSGISLIDEAPLDPEFMNIVPHENEPDKVATEFVKVTEDSPATVLPEPETSATYDYRSRY